MSKFKVGDKIRFLGKAAGGYETSFWIPGKVYTFKKYLRYDGNDFDSICVTEGGSNHVGAFELAFPPTESELERLVRVANEGIKAISELRDRSGEVEIASAHHGKVYAWSSVSFGFLDGHFQLRIKPKQRPLPEPIYVGRDCNDGGPLPGWKVELSADRKTVKVGCQSFDVDVAQNALSSLVRSNHCVYALIDHNLCATKQGVKYGSNSITWADADRLLAWLEAALKDEKEAA